MRGGRYVVGLVLVAGWLGVGPEEIGPRPARAQGNRDIPLNQETVTRSIMRARRFLVSRQKKDGSWGSPVRSTNPVGVSSLALLALVNAGMATDDASIRLSLSYLRRVRKPAETYDAALMISALAAVKDGNRDQGDINTLARQLQQNQIKSGPHAGLWDYTGPGPGDRSNGQFAILGLRDAAHAGVSVDRRVWERARQHWLRFQNRDGGWSYSGGQVGSTGSMTVAGIATLEITAAMLRDDRDLKPDGTPNCCAATVADAPLEGALAWMGRKFRVGVNPGSHSWLLYYLYGMERAGRLSGRRFFGEHDWYREGAHYLINGQNQQTGSWAVTGIEKDPVIATSFALLFLSKGLAPVLVNKLQFANDDNWNKHHDDARNLTEHITGLDKWPKLLTWQVLDTRKAATAGHDVGVQYLTQGSVQLLTGKDAPDFSDAEVRMLRTYLDQGGFVFAVNCCNGAGFFDGMFKLVKELYPDGEAELKPLRADHPVYRSEYLFRDPESVKLYGVDFGCRTVIIFTPEDLSCLWNKWMRQDPPGRPAAMKLMVIRALKIGVNVIAYATGREPPDKLTQHEMGEQGGQEDRVERGLLKLPKLRHNGGWNDAPLAIRNLLLALNRTYGKTASTRARDIPATDPDIFRYPIVYMHGRNAFAMSRAERAHLKKYLDRGGLLFADAICGAPAFNRSFRTLVRQLYPKAQLERIPADHELFRLELGHDIRKVKRRVVGAAGAGRALDMQILESEPVLEGLRVDGSYVIIYSRYDLSCALQRQASVACSGYVTRDAVRIAINVILYAMLQDVASRDRIRGRNRAGRKSQGERLKQSWMPTRFTGSASYFFTLLRTSRASHQSAWSSTSARRP